MAGSVNKVILVGNLGREPEVKSMQDGRSLVNMSVATSETWRDRNSGERKERTEWHRVVIFNDKLAEVAQKFPEEGRQGLSRGPAHHAQVDRPERPGTLTRPRVVIPRFGGSLTMLDGRSGGGEGGGGMGRRLRRRHGRRCGMSQRGRRRVAVAVRHRAARPSSTTTFRSRPCGRSSWEGRASFGGRVLCRLPGERSSHRPDDRRARRREGRGPGGPNRRGRSRVSTATCAGISIVCSPAGRSTS